MKPLQEKVHLIRPGGGLADFERGLTARGGTAAFQNMRYDSSIRATQ